MLSTLKCKCPPPPPPVPRPWHLITAGHWCHKLSPRAKELIKFHFPSILFHVLCYYSLVFGGWVLGSRAHIVENNRNGDSKKTSIGTGMIITGHSKKKKKKGGKKERKKRKRKKTHSRNQDVKIFRESWRFNLLPWSPEGMVSRNQALQSPRKL